MLFVQASYQKFIDRSPVLVKTNELLANHITFKVGGPADLFVEIFNKNDLVSIFELVNKLKIPHFLLGGGSNVIFSDEGFRGVVIKYANDDIEVGDLKAKIGAGCSLNKMVLSLAKEGLGGVNFLANIPGFLGGAIVGNAGCYGSEIKGVLESVTLFDKDKLKFDIVDPEDLSFGYRHSDLKSKTNLVVVEAILNLEQVNYKDVKKAVDEEWNLRVSKHPQEPSAGSFFKNPERGIAAWKFIEESGMKGKEIGGAKVSKKHANFLINTGDAVASDIIKLSSLVKQKVKEKTEVQLVEEVRIIK